MTGEMGFEFYSEVKLLKSYFGTNCAVIVAEGGENKGRNFCNMTDEEGDCSLSLSLSLSLPITSVVHPSSYPSILPFPSPLSFQSSLFIRYRAYTGARAGNYLSIGLVATATAAASLICLSLTASPSVRPSVRQLHGERGGITHAPSFGSIHPSRRSPKRVAVPTWTI